MFGQSNDCLAANSAGMKPMVSLALNLRCQIFDS